MRGDGLPLELALRVALVPDVLQLVRHLVIDRHLGAVGEPGGEG